MSSRTSSPSDRRSRTLPARRWIVLSVLIAGAALRLGIFASNLAPINSDEAITGLMALRLLEGEPTTFFWGQAWGGTPEVVPVAISLRAFGTSVPALRVPTLLLSAAIPVLVWRIARRCDGDAMRGSPGDRALVAGLAAWIWPPAAVWFGTREMLFYLPVIALGLVMTLLSQRIVEDARRWLEWTLVGFAAGLGWWISPSIVYFAVPLGVWLLVRCRRNVWPGAAMAGVAALVGALPWIRFNLQSRGASFDYPGYWATGSYLDHVNWFFTHGLPGVLGLRVPFSEEWLLGPVGVVVYLAALGLLAVAIIIGARLKSAEALLLVSFPFLFALNPFGMTFGNLRYLIFLAPLLALPLLRIPTGAIMTPSVLSALLLVTTLTLTQMSSITEHIAGVVPEMDPLVAVLDEEGVEHVWADYWIAYRLAFESDESVVAAPTSILNRYEPYTDAVRGDREAAWVTVTASAQTEALREALRDLGVDGDELEAGEYTVFRPTHPVLPEELPAEALNFMRP